MWLLGSTTNPRCFVKHTRSYARELKLPSLPEMVFPKNTLRLEHQSGASIEFCALDALRLVDPDKESVQVAAAQEWKATRWEESK